MTTDYRLTIDEQNGRESRVFFTTYEKANREFDAAVKRRVARVQWDEIANGEIVPVMIWQS